MLIRARAGKPCIRLVCMAGSPLTRVTCHSTGTGPAIAPISAHQRELAYRSRRSFSAGTRDAAACEDEVSGYNIINEESALVAEANARQARLRYGSSLPEGLLSTGEFKIYERLYGSPISMIPADEAGESTMTTDDTTKPEALDYLRSQEVLTEENELIEEEEEDEVEEEEEEEENDDEIETEEEMWEVAEEQKDSKRRMDRAQAEEEYWLMTAAHEGPSVRMHPSTIAGRFGQNRDVVLLPKETMLAPTSDVLRTLPNKHLKSTAQEKYGSRLEHSVATPITNGQHLHQRPPPLSAFQSSMGAMEAGAYIASNTPGIYATVTTVLSEVRKRLGETWLQQLFRRPSGPRILDVGGVGASVQSWRDVLRAEWARIHANADPIPECPLGRSTVIAGSEQLTDRIKSFSSDTAFVPRLPDFERARDLPGSKLFEPGARKHYDIIVASHSLWQFSEEWERRNHVQNLWSLLDPNGGILVIIEKGVPHAFELVAGARKLLLDQHIRSTSIDSTEGARREPATTEKGMIIAPCTNHGTCPMYTIPGEMARRKDFCRFTTKFARPDYLQRLHSGPSGVEEQINFSFLAVQRGVDLRETQSISQDDSATAAALLGVESHLTLPSNSTATSSTHSISTSSATFNAPFPSADAVVTDATVADPMSDTTTTAHPLSLPRVILPPIKRKGHVIFDVCTPSATIERWILPKSHGTQAYHDARKARWGDLWALGAKSRTPRAVRSGEPKAPQKGQGKVRSKAGKGGRERARSREQAREEDRGGGMVWID